MCTCCAFYPPKANLFCSKWRNPRVRRESRLIVSNQKSVFTRPDMLRDRFDSWMVTCATSLFSSFCSNAKQVARFRCPFDRSNWNPHAFPFSPSQPLCGSAVLHPWKRNTKQTVLICYVERILGALFNSALQLSDGTMEFCQTGILAVESCWHCRWIHTMLNTFANAPPLQEIDQTPRALSTKANSESFRRFRRQIVRYKTRNSW